MDDNIKYLNDESFDSEIAAGVSLVDFYADWCGPCRMMEPVIAELAVNRNDVKFFKMDIEGNQKIPTRFSITSIPTIIVFRDGKEINRMIGVQTYKDLVGKLPPA